MNATAVEVPFVDFAVGCKYDKVARRITVHVSSFGHPFKGYPRSFDLYTGRLVRFHCIDSSDPLFDEDQWDGMQQIYRPEIILPKVDHLVVVSE